MDRFKILSLKLSKNNNKIINDDIIVKNNCKNIECEHSNINGKIHQITVDSRE